MSAINLEKTQKRAEKSRRYRSYWATADPLDMKDPVPPDPGDDESFEYEHYSSSDYEEEDSCESHDSDSDYDECVFEICVPSSLVEDAVFAFNTWIDEHIGLTPLETQVEVLTVKQAEQDPLPQDLLPLPLDSDFSNADLLCVNPPLRLTGGMKSRSKKRRIKKPRKSGTKIIKAQGRIRVRTPLTGKDLGFDRAYIRDFTTVFPQIVSGTTVPTTGFFTFQFSDVASSANLSSDFEWFRIDKVKVHFQALDTTVLNNNSTSAIQTMTPNFAAAVDTNGVGYTPSTIAQVLNYANSKYTVATRDLRFTFRPIYNSQTYKSSTQVGYAPGELMLRTADANEPHYGLLYWMDVPGGANPVAGAYAYNVIVKYYITFAGGK
jgi:hypothetical protein